MILDNYLYYKFVFWYSEYKNAVEPRRFLVVILPNLYLFYLTDFTDISYFPFPRPARKLDNVQTVESSSLLFFSWQIILRVERRIKVLSKWLRLSTHLWTRFQRRGTILPRRFESGPTLVQRPCPGVEFLPPRQLIRRVSSSRFITTFQKFNTF